jgi:hypothetical protein
MTNKNYMKRGRMGGNMNQTHIENQNGEGFFDDVFDGIKSVGKNLLHAGVDVAGSALKGYAQNKVNSHFGIGVNGAGRAKSKWMHHVSLVKAKYPHKSHKEILQISKGYGGL